MNYCNRRGFLFYAIVIVFVQMQVIVNTHCSQQNSIKNHDDNNDQISIAIIGTGYVGLISGAGLAQFGNKVTCADINAAKIKSLQEGTMPIFEPGLQEVVARNVAEGNLLFTHDVARAIHEADVVFIAVDTPMGEDGSADLRAVESVVESIAANINRYTIIVTKSTVPIGTGKKIESMMTEKYSVSRSLFDVVSNPEFLREGSAMQDFLHPDRLVIGTESKSSLEVMIKIYQCIINQGVPCVYTNIVTAETIKYASNAFLATKLSFINEIANLCDKTGADIQIIGHAMGLDHRISPQFLKVGPGFGGSCFPKDTQALLYMAQEHGIQLYTVQAALDANVMQQQIPVQKLIRLLQKRGDHSLLRGKKIAVLGLAFKANTDDIRYSPAIETISLLLSHGASVQVYDPAAMDNMSCVFTDLTYCSSLYEAVTNVDAIIIMTEWDEFKHMNLAVVGQLVSSKIIIDARNILHHEELKQHGFIGDTIGQSYLYDVMNM